MKRALLLVTLLVGCSFPEPTIVDEPADTSVVADAPSETAVDSAASDLGVTDSADGAADATDTADVSDTKVSVCETSNDCDCDGDGDEAKRTGCSGNDCDDGDKRRNSLVTSFLDYSVTGLSHAGDWDCVGGVTREYGNTAVSCSGLALGGCAGVQGYAVASPTCGTDVDFVRCKVNAGIACVEESRTKLRVKCK